MTDALPTPILPTKEQIKIEVDKLLSLKNQFKQQSGEDWNVDWKPKTAAAVNDPVPINSGAGGSDEDAIVIDNQIRQQGDKIRKMKAEKVEKKQLESEVQLLLKLKNDFFSL